MSATDIIAVIALVVSIAMGAAAVVSLLFQIRESGRRDEEMGLLPRRGEATGRGNPVAPPAGRRRVGGSATPRDERMVAWCPLAAVILRAAAENNEANVGVYADVVRAGLIRRSDPVTVS